MKLSTSLFYLFLLASTSIFADQSQTKTTQFIQAALHQTKEGIIYNPTYFKIPYPNGDIPAHYGVCTDVVIRAYRKLGIDLQEQVHYKNKYIRISKPTF